MLSRWKTSRGSRSDSIVILFSDSFNHSILLLYMATESGLIRERNLASGPTFSRIWPPKVASSKIGIHNIKSSLLSLGEILTFPDTLTTQGLSLWCFNIVGGEILIFPDTLTTQGLSLWCFNIVQDCRIGPRPAAYTT